ncbi:hypothetical protein [Lentibacter sp. XHP0401]|jgi:hypothetical protein|uniref:hypothetical protein n=1 Tax=Lentibacter sp. XHP0401 TaxID=2984334 RepID=UPI0021E761F1|nr:hypothetical protein [Lentibacter sp. XHP0401]MCV2893621.1 hypothetical protein [Lentibacter sp. XHP0401]
MQFIWFGILGFILLTIIYVLISIYSRSVRREWLEDEWAEQNEAGETETDRDTFVEAGMARYQSGFRRKLILLVYVIPTIAVVTLIYVIN